jgi:hypothetical protein
MRLADKRTADEEAHRARDRKSKDQDVVDERVDDEPSATANEVGPGDHS